MSTANSGVNYAQGHSVGHGQDQKAFAVTSPCDLELGLGLSASINSTPGQPTSKSALSTRMTKDHQHAIKKARRVRAWVWWILAAVLLAIPPILFATRFSSVNVRGIRLLVLLVWLEILWLSLWFLHLLTWIASELWNHLCKEDYLDMKFYRRFLYGIRRSLLLFLLTIVSWASIRPLCYRLDHGSCNGAWINKFRKTLLSLLIIAAALLVKSSLVEIIIARSAVNLFIEKLLGMERALNALKILKQVIKKRSGEPPRPGRRYHSQCWPFLQSPARLLEWLLVRTLPPTEDDVIQDNMKASLEELFWKGVKSSSRPESAKSDLLDIEELFTYGEDKFRHAHPTPFSKTEVLRIFAVGDRECKSISIEEWEMVNVGAFKAKKHIKNGIAGIRSAVSSVDRVISVIVLIAALVLVYAIFSPDHFNSFWTLAWTTFTGISFALSGTATEFLSSCAFVFAKQPYGVGDHVTIGERDLIVDEIHLTHTIFRGIADGVVEQISHSQLNTNWITNHYRSRDIEGLKMTAKISFFISPKIPFERIQSMIEAIKHKLEAFTSQDLPCSYYFGDVGLKVLPTATEGVHDVQLVMSRRHVIIPLDPVDKGRTRCRRLVLDKLYDLMQAEISAALRESQNPGRGQLPGTPSTLAPPGTPPGSV
ncbi:hypothetical protein GP486_000876 [Trichoglossum hirsutum]|uniref:Mechanosensitive ion channel protein n=1 Tax=Trichoglossum hirsutum TaxID=265104 RepID=A0A9P8LI82_9PEZI|nr:hypothetical protein GP486_000876 [Trichoglossum hirsutum]